MLNFYNHESRETLDRATETLKLNAKSTLGITTINLRADFETSHDALASGAVTPQKMYLN